MRNLCIRWMATSCFLLVLHASSGQGAAYFQRSFSESSLPEIFKALESRFGARFAYDEEALADVKITRTISAESLADALDQLCVGTGLVYQIPAPGQVLLRKEENKVSAPAPSYIEIKGSVSDAWNGSPLAFAHIVFPDGQGIAADEQGKFSGKVPLSETGVSLRVQYIGYQTKEVRLDKSGPHHDLSIRLVPRIEKLPGITVKERAPVFSTYNGQDGIRMQVPALARMSFFVGGKDLFRGIQMLPGVDASNDLSADLSIRSSNGDENLVLLDGMTLYNVTHFFGIFSIVNPNLIDQVKIYKNAFPAEYGGRTAAVIDMRTQPMRQEGWKGILDVNLLTSSGVVEAPTGKKSSLLLGFRTANQNLGNSSLFDQSNLNREVVATFMQGRPTARTVTSQQPDFYFNDANLKWTWQPSPRTNLLLSYFRGRDRFGLDYKRTTYPPIRRVVNYIEETYAEDARWQNDGLGLQWEQQWNPSLGTHATLVHTGYESSTVVETAFSRILDSRPIPILPLENIHFNQIGETNLNLKNTLKLREGQSLHFGYQGAQSQVRFRIREDGINRLNGDETAPQHALYAQYLSGQWLKNLSIDAGLRLTSFEGKSYLSPRLYVHYALAPDFSLKASYGLYQQFVRQLYHEDRFGRSFQYWVLSDNRFPVAVSNSFMLGFSHKNKWFDLDVEGYSKDTKGIMEHALQYTGLSVDDGKPVTPRYNLFLGEGRVQGIDILLQKSTPTYAWWAAYTLSKATQSFPNVLRGSPFPAPNDRRHQLKLNGQYSLKRFNLGATYIFSSGRPYTDLSLVNSPVNDRTQLRPEERVSYLNDYHRVDLYAHYTFPMRTAEGTIGINLFNVTNHNNVKYRQFIYSFVTPAEPGNPSTKSPVNTVIGAELEMLRFTPNLSFQIKF